MSTSAQSNVPRRLTVAMIARDADSLIAKTIQSVQPIADEIVVVDTGSTDSTRSIAASLGAMVVDWNWTDDFSAARNVGLSRATGEWILWIDAGETVTPDDAARLRQFVDRAADSNTLYMMLVMMPPEEGQVRGEQAGRFRLMPRRDDLVFAGRLRENVVASATTAGMQMDAIEMRIHRSAHDLDPNVKQAKAERDLRLADLEIGESPTTPNAHLAKGEALVLLGSAAAARPSFQTARQVALAGSGEMLESYYGELTSYDGTIAEQRDQQLAVCLEALEHVPTDSQLLCAMGSYLQAQGRIDLAQRAYQTAHLHGQVRPEIWHLGDIADVALVCLGLTLQLQNKDEEARAILETALGEGRTTADRVRRQLIEICIKLNDRQAALAQVDQLTGAAEDHDTLRTAIRGACLAAQSNWISAKAYLETALNAGCQDAVCYRNLIKSLVALHETEEARATLEQWRQNDPTNPEIAALLQSLGGEPAAASPASTGPVTPQIRIDQPSGSTTSLPPRQAPASTSATPPRSV